MTIIPPGLKFRDLKSAAAQFNRNAGESEDARICYLLACLADGVTRRAVNNFDAIDTAIYHAGGELCVISQRLHRITGGFIRDAFGQEHGL